MKKRSRNRRNKRTAWDRVDIKQECLHHSHPCADDEWMSCYDNDQNASDAYIWENEFLGCTPQLMARWKYTQCCEEEKSNLEDQRAFDSQKWTDHVSALVPQRVRSSLQSTRLSRPVVSIILSYMVQEPHEQLAAEILHGKQPWAIFSSANGLQCRWILDQPRVMGCILNPSNIRLNQLDGQTDQHGEPVYCWDDSLDIWRRMCREYYARVNRLPCMIELHACIYDCLPGSVADILIDGDELGPHVDAFLYSCHSGRSGNDDDIPREWMSGRQEHYGFSFRIGTASLASIKDQHHNVDTTGWFTPMHTKVDVWRRHQSSLWRAPYPSEVHIRCQIGQEPAIDGAESIVYRQPSLASFLAQWTMANTKSAVITALLSCLRAGWQWTGFVV
jgi:hypothetical protein